MLRAIDHVQIAIPPGGEERARPFYRDLLGLTEVPKPEPLAKRGGCWFEAGSIKVHLGVEQDFRANTKAHVAFLVDDVAAITDRAVAAGYAIKPDDELGDVERVFIYDPFGNRLEFLKPKAATVSPFPLEGGRVGDGGGGVSARAVRHERPAGATARARRLRSEMTFAEQVLWKELRKSELRFRRQAPMGRFIADFVSHAAKLVVEVDGYWHSTPERQAHDAQRTAWLNSIGYRVIRFSDYDARERTSAVIDTIHAEPPPSPSPTLPPSRGKGDARYDVR
jgi:very-short-patch-repair endonuclease/catechol 2,3-dioxygenase-like lactoylglutathione lyase family enzyme